MEHFYKHPMKNALVNVNQALFRIVALLGINCAQIARPRAANAWKRRVSARNALRDRYCFY